MVYSPFQLPISFMDKNRNNYGAIKRASLVLKTKNNYGAIKRASIVQRPNS
jgi:hypothetical protein